MLTHACSGFLEGINSKGKPILKMDKVYFTYTGNAAN
jgi:hypothetical protein